MATRVTTKQYSDVFKLMTQNSLKKTREDLLQLQETTDTVFKQTKDRSYLYTGVKTAIEILAKEKYPQANYQILVELARKTTNSAIKICALQNAVTAYLKYDEWDQALVAAKEISDDDPRDQALSVIIQRMIETEDLQKALDTIEKDDISDFDIEGDLCAKIVAKFIEIKAEKEEIALRAADKACCNRTSANLALFFAQKKKINRAMEALGEIQDQALMEQTFVKSTQYLATEADLETVIDFLNEANPDNLLSLMEKLATAYNGLKNSDHYLSSSKLIISIKMEIVNGTDKKEAFC